MSNYDDPFHRSHGADPNRPLDPYNAGYEGKSGTGILVGLLVVFVLLVALFAFSGGAPPEGEGAPEAGTTSAPPAGTVPDSVPDATIPPGGTQ